MSALPAASAGLTPIPEFAEVMRSLAHKRELSPAAMRTMVAALFSGTCGDVEAAAFLVGLRMKGETARELATAVEVMRQHMLRWDAGRSDVLDTCGTGGDGHATFNISTATALVVAGCGVPVVKHGNRAVSSTCGSADVLDQLGVTMVADGAAARQCLDKVGLAFCFAPFFHPALKHLGQLRRRLGIPTLFNSLGPLANPAGAAYQLLGVGRAELLDLLAEAVAELGTRQTLVVHSADGLDEVSLSAPTAVRCVCAGQVTALEWTHADFGLPACRLQDLQARDAQASAAIIRGLLDGRQGPARDIVLANTAAALLAAQRVQDLPSGVQLAAQSIDSGRAREVLQQLVEVARTS